MAKEWTVTPSEGVINNNDGTFEFSANTTFCDKTYIIEYKDTSDGCACNAVFTQVGKDCSTTYDDPIWVDDPDCEHHPGESRTINGYYWIHPRHLEGCSTCVDDPSYSASTSMTVTCPVPCTLYAAGESYSWCEGSDYGTCGYVGCVDGDLSGIDYNSISVSVTSDPKNMISGNFHIDHDSGENYYRIRTKINPMDCDGGNRSATLSVSVNGETKTITTTQYGCKSDCSKDNCCCTDTNPCD